MEEGGGGAMFPQGEPNPFGGVTGRGDLNMLAAVTTGTSVMRSGTEDRSCCAPADRAGIRRETAAKRDG